MGAGMINFRTIASLSLAICCAACATIDYDTTKQGVLSGNLFVMWVGEDKFVFAPDPASPLTFQNATRKIRPGIMYTDGGSIPKLAQPLGGFSPWGYAPAYMIHDWIFVGHHCVVDGKNDGRFNDVKDVEFHESATILAEVIKTLIESKQVPRHDLAFSAISNSVDSFVARNLWDKPGACETIDPKHLAAVHAHFGTTPGTRKSLFSSPLELILPDATRRRIGSVPRAKVVARFSFGPAR
jgi:hypothetical protein